MAAALKPSEPLNTSASEAISYTRLHITPLDESLLSLVVPSSVLPRARNISYHVIETFPEKRYGFVELPTTDAEKIRKKINGAVLKGSKMRIEKAKPESIPQPTAGIDGAEAKKDKRKSKKRKREADVTPGVELDGRKVKRGWTTTEREMIEEKRKKSKDKKDKKDKKSKTDKEEKKKKKREAKSKYTDRPECLFKTKLPGAGSSSKDNEEDVGHKRKKRKSGREVIVHEFEKTVKHPSFLKSTAEKSNSEPLTFQDGVGWVDEKGTVVEAVVSKRLKKTPSELTAAKLEPSETVPEAEDDDTTSSSGSSSNESGDDDDDDGAPNQEADSTDEEERETKPPPKSLNIDTQTLVSPVSTMKPESARPKSSGSITSLTIKIPPVTPAATKIHPLEALYKRPKGDATAPGGATKEAEPFSFFDGDDHDDNEEDVPMGPPSQPPMTPYTKQDFEYRNVRSAAPTPDTAHPSRTFNLWPRPGSADDIPEGNEDEEEQEDDDENIAMAGTSSQGATADGDKQTPVSDFQKQFWESRGDLNRSWRKRRKTASKEKRYRENRVRAERAI
ncbi:hypothetical protein GGS26DRAFT_393796 [Hypomontagnella submonticulosa]|nr:hypothetical protein GGS26DRAFT_393796 [Hypomontagnella submonticulosa]